MHLAYVKGWLRSQTLDNDKQSLTTCAIINNDCGRPISMYCRLFSAQIASVIIKEICVLKILRQRFACPQQVIKQMREPN